MKATELRIGNLVLINGEVCPVGYSAICEVAQKEKGVVISAFHTKLDSVKFEPIPLTEKWVLENTEFRLYETITYEHVGTGTRTKCRKYAMPDPDAEFDNYEFSIMFVVDPDTDEFRNVQFHCYGHDISGGNIQKDSVHRLQNTYHTVTGEELTIESKPNTVK